MAGSVDDYNIGRLVLSTQGRDKGKIYVIIGMCENGFLLVADGNQRVVERPKRKNPKHVEDTGINAFESTGAPDRGEDISDSMIRMAIKEYRKTIGRDKEDDATNG